MIIVTTNYVSLSDVINNTNREEKHILSKEVFSNERFTKFIEVPVNTQYECNLIYPALDQDLFKYGPKDIIRKLETFQAYKDNIYPLALNQNLDWIDNILERKAEQERILYEDDDFVLLPDLKWDVKDLDNLYCLAIVKDKSLKCIRELNNTHLDLLEDIYNKGLLIIKNHYGVAEQELRVYFHYPPTFYHLHIHFNLIKNNLSRTSIDDAISLISVMNNIKFVPDYYQKICLEITESQDRFF